MTLKQDRLAKEVLNPANKTLREAGIKAGYSKNTRYIYTKDTKITIADRLSRQNITKESLREAYENLLRETQKDKDHSTSKGILDSICKLYNLIKDNTIHQAIFTDVIQEIRQVKQPVDNSSSEAIDTEAHT